MGEISHHSEATLIIAKEQIELVDKISESKLSEIVLAGAESTKKLCSLHTWYSKHAGTHGGATIEYPCEMTYDTIREDDHTVRVALQCGKAICKGEDAVIRAAEVIDKSVNQASKEMSRLIGRNIFSGY